MNGATVTDFFCQSRQRLVCPNAPREVLDREWLNSKTLTGASRFFCRRDLKTAPKDARTAKPDHDEIKHPNEFRHWCKDDAFFSTTPARSLFVAPSALKHESVNFQLFYIYGK